MGTAGHVDHGKTTLVKALTGVDTDRLPQEKARGLSIELGFAPLKLSKSLVAGVVDVPGHERFIKTMISGATSIEAVLLIVAADEGIQQQTQEHLEIVRLLKVKEIVCALTKADLASPIQLEKQKKEIQRYLAGQGYKDVPLISVSAQTDQGIESLKQALAQLGHRILKQNLDPSVMMLPIDRAFSKPGFGPIITGTLSGGALSQHDNITILPDGIMCTVRGLEIFGEPVTTAEPITRVAVNLSGVKLEKLHRGQCISFPNEIKPTTRIHAQVTWKKSLQIQKKKIPKHVYVHAGTQNFLARLRFSETPDSTFVELDFDQPLVIRNREKFLLRSMSPLAAIAGGQVLDPLPDTSIRKVDLSVWKNPTQDQILFYWLNSQRKMWPLKELVQHISLPINRVESMLSPLIKNGAVLERKKLFCSKQNFEACLNRLLNLVEKKPEHTQADILGDSSLPQDMSLKIFALEKALENKSLLQKGGRLQIPGRVSKAQHPSVEFIESAGFSPPTVKEIAEKFHSNPQTIRKLLAREENRGTLVRLSNEIYCGQKALDQALKITQEHFSKHATLDISGWKKSTGLSRKFAVPWLEYLDREKITLCRPDRTRIKGPNLR